MRAQPLGTLIDYVRLADAYQLIGKTEYPDTWVDHEIGIFTKLGISAVSLAAPEFTQPPQRRVIEPQYKRLNDNSLKRATIVNLDDEGIGRHNSMSQFIYKLIRDGAFTLRLENNLERKSFSDLDEIEAKFLNLDYLQSTLFLITSDNTKITYDVLVVAESLKRLLILLSSHRRVRAKPKSNAGRKVSTASQQTNNIIESVVKKHPQIKVAKEIARLSQIDLKKQSISLTVDAIEKRINRKKMMRP